MDLSRIVVAIRRRWWILVLAIIIGGLTGFVVTKVQTPEYEATTRLFVSTTGGTSSTESYSGEQFSQQRVASYAEMITSEQITQGVVNELGLQMSARDLSAHITATIVPRTVLLDVAARDSSPQRAADIANTLAAKFVQFLGPLETPVGQEQPRSTVVVVKTAEVPTSATSPRLGTNLFYGLLGGVAAGLMGILLTSLLITRVYSADELKRLTGTPVLGPVRSPNRKPEERRDQLSTGYDDADADAIRRVRVQIEAQDPVPQVLLLVPISAGAAAINLGIDLATSFSEAGRTTALVCADPQFTSLSSNLGLKSDRRGLSDLLSGGATLEQTIKGTPRRTLAFVSPGQSTDVTPLLSSPAMSGFVDELRKRFDRIILITASVNESSGASVLSAVVDSNLLVVDAQSARRGGIESAMSSLKAARAHLVGAVLVNT